jgi:hypothetical protein
VFCEKLLHYNIIWIRDNLYFDFFLRFQTSQNFEKVNPFFLPKIILSFEIHKAFFFFILHFNFSITIRQSNFFFSLSSNEMSIAC